MSSQKTYKQLTSEDKDRIVNVLIQHYLSLRADIIQHIQGYYGLLGGLVAATVAAMGFGFANW